MSSSQKLYEVESWRNYGRFVGIARYIRDSDSPEAAAKYAVKYLLEALEQHDNLQSLKREEKLCNPES